MKITGKIFGRDFNFVFGKDAKRSYKAAKNNRITAGWTRTSYPANQEIKADLSTLRARARDLEQNDSLGARYLSLTNKNIVGPFGFTLNVKAHSVDKTGKPLLNDKGNPIIDVVASNKIRNAFKRWSVSKYADVAQQESFLQIQHLVLTHAMRDGEFLVRKVRSKNNPFGFALQVLEPDVIDEQYNAELTNGNVVVMGIEIDKNWKRVAFHLKKYEPKRSTFSIGYSIERERISADEIYYGFERSRAFAQRGVTRMSAAMLRIKLLWEYERASATNAVVNARRLGFITKTEDANAEFVGTDVDANNNPIVEVEDMSLMELQPGYDVNIPAPNYPDAQHEMFAKTESKLIASGLDVSHASLTGDLSEANYSSARVGLLDERETWMMRQEWFIEKFLEPVYEDWLEAAILSNQIELGVNAFAQFERFNQPYWIGRRWNWVDPEKDANAKLIELRSGMTSLMRVAAERGDDLDDILNEIAEVQAKAKEKEVTLDFGSELVLQEESQNDSLPSDSSDGGRFKKIKKNLRQVRTLLNQFNGELEEA